MIAGWILNPVVFARKRVLVEMMRRCFQAGLFVYCAKRQFVSKVTLDSGHGCRHFGVEFIRMNLFFIEYLLGGSVRG